MGKNKKIFFLALFFFLISWGARLYKIFFIVEKGLLMDFFAYYRTVRSFFH